MTIIVQPLGLEDVEWFTEVAAVRMITEELKRPELVDLDSLYTLVGMGMQNGTAWIAKDGFNKIGALGAILVPNMFNRNIRTLSEVFWWVDGEYRNSRAGALLLFAFEKRAKEIADESTMSLLPSSPLAISALEKRGHVLGEFGFRKGY